jgi:hypothetical protein
MLKSCPAAQRSSGERFRSTMRAEVMVEHALELEVRWTDPALRNRPGWSG